MTNQVRVGVGVILGRNGNVLLGLRKSKHGHGMWSFPGGHLEYGESPIECARRELKEETGLTFTDATHGPYTNDFFTESGKHYITLFVLVDDVKGEPKVCEPDKCAEWRWFAWDALPKPLFLPIQNLIQSGFTPW